MAPSQEKTPISVGGPDNKLPPSEESSARAPLTSDDDHESAPVIHLDFAEGNPKPVLTSANLNPDLSLNSNTIPNPTLDQSQDQTLGAQALLPGSPSGNPALLNEPFLPSLDPSLLNLNNKPSSPTHALNLLKICQTPNLSTIQPPTLSPTQSSPSVASSIQHFNTLDTCVQTPPRRNSQSSPFIWIEEALNTMKADF